MHRGTCFTYPVVQVGDTQYFSFREGDPPPFYKPDCPERDLMTGEMQAARKVRAKPKGNTYFVQMGRGDSTAPLPDATRAQVQKKIPGFVDKPKGMRDILRERGLLNPSLTYTKTNAVFLRIFFSISQDTFALTILTLPRTRHGVCLTSSGLVLTFGTRKAPWPSLPNSSVS